MMVGIEQKLNGKKILVIGYAMTGKSVVEFLLHYGAHVTLNDRGILLEDSSVRLFLSRGVEVVEGGHPLELLEQEFDFIVKNPGIPYRIPLIQAAQERGIPIYTDVELAYWTSAAPIVGITGSNGKTTTSSWIYQLLQHRQKGQAYLAGNIGVPSLETAVKVTQDDVVVMELSSFQLMGTQQFKPQIAVMTNVTSAHLDYHGSQSGYEQAKFQLVANQTQADYFVYNAEDQIIASHLDTVKAQLIPFSANGLPKAQQQVGAYREGDGLYFRGEWVASVQDVGIPGQHNLENALAALAVAKLMAVSNESIQKVLREYTGMPHRLQPVAQSAGRQFYNDSKSTNMVAAMTALKSFAQPIRYIGGGLDRGNEFDELIPYLIQVESAYLYGESKEKMARAFQAAGVPVVELVDTLEAATTRAYHAAQAGDVVLFSPSCASWDQFKNFEIRGEHFVKLVQHLLKTSPYSKKGDESNERN